MYERILELIRTHFYVLYTESFYQKNSDIFVERIVAKHPKLRPELIVINDELQGFKKVTEHISSLEKFPIFIEIEGVEEDGKRYVDALDVYAEGKVPISDHMTEMVFLGNLYKRVVSIDRVMRLNDVTKESMVIMSKVNELFESGLYQNLFLAEPYQEEIELTIEKYFEGLTVFVQVLDDILVKGKTLKQVKDLHKTLLGLDDDILE